MVKRFLLAYLAALTFGCGEPESASPTPTAPSEPAVAPNTPTTGAVSQAPVGLATRAAQLGALPFSQLSRMKAGEEALFLIQGQASGAAVYGSGPYTIDSFPPVAAVHAGILKDGEWGIVRVRVVQHDGDHPGTEKNGVRTRNWGTLDRSYTIELVQ